MSLTYFTLTPLINAVTSIGLAMYILYSGTKVRAAKYVVIFCCVVAGWSIPYFFWQIAGSAAAALFWARMLMIAGVFSGTVYIHLVLVFLDRDREHGAKLILWILYFISLFFLSADATDLFVAAVAPKLSFPFWPLPGPLYIYFILFYTAEALTASILLLQSYLRAKGKNKLPIGLVLAGLALAFFGGATNFLLWYDIPIAPWGNGLVALYVFLTAYAIMNYNFLNLRVIAADIITAVLVAIFFLQTIVSPTQPGLPFRIFTLIIVGLLGWLMARSTRREVRRREELHHLADTLKHTNQQLEKKNVKLLRKMNAKLSDTNRKLEQSNRRMARANEKLRELDKSKAEFLMIAAHQLRTPVSAVSGYIDLIETGAYGKLETKLRQAVRGIDESNQRLVKLIDLLLEISEMEHNDHFLSIKQVNVNDVVKKIVSAAGAGARAKKLRLQTVLDSEITAARGDSNHIGEALRHLVDNAIQYSDSGTITVATSRVGRGVHVSVRDEGVGFKKQDKHLFFQKFSRGHNVERVNVNYSSGLGLYLVARIIKGHRGTVFAESPGPDKGSTFGFWIPSGRTEARPN